MSSRKLSEIKSSNVRIPDICFGTSALGNMPDTYDYEVNEARAVETIKTVLQSESPFLDCSRNYGMGRSEQRIGVALRELGGLPANAVISTKLDRNMDTGFFDASQARRSLEESFTAMGIDHVDILHLHDPEHAESLAPITNAGGALDELFKIRDEGLCRVVGLAAGNVKVMLPLLKEYDFDILVTHNRHTLVNGNAEEMINYAVANDIAVMNAAPYCGGVLAKGTASFNRYVYQEIGSTELASLKVVEEICHDYGIPPGAAALQFSLKDQRITSTICGVSKPERVAQTLEWANYAIPAAAWDALNVLSRTSDDPEAARDYKPG